MIFSLLDILTIEKYTKILSTVFLFPNIIINIKIMSFIYVISVEHISIFLFSIWYFSTKSDHKHPSFVSLPILKLSENADKIDRTNLSGEPHFHLFRILWLSGRTAVVHHSPLWTEWSVFSYRSFYSKEYELVDERELKTLLVQEEQEEITIIYSSQNMHYIRPNLSFILNLSCPLSERLLFATFDKNHSIVQRVKLL